MSDRWRQFWGGWRPLPTLQVILPRDGSVTAWWCRQGVADATMLARSYRVRFGVAHTTIELMPLSREVTHDLFERMWRALEPGESMSWGPYGPWISKERSRLHHDHNTEEGHHRGSA